MHNLPRARETIQDELKTSFGAVASANEIDRIFASSAHIAFVSRRSSLDRTTMKIFWILAACVAVAAAAPANEDDDESVRCRKVQVGVTKPMNDLLIGLLF